MPSDINRTTVDSLWQPATADEKKIDLEKWHLAVYQLWCQYGNYIYFLILTAVNRSENLDTFNLLGKIRNYFFFKEGKNNYSVKLVLAELGKSTKLIWVKLSFAWFGCDSYHPNLLTELHLKLPNQDTSYLNQVKYCHKFWTVWHICKL